MKPAGNGLPLPLAPSIPQFPQNRWCRACAWAFERGGWRMVGSLPDLPQVVLVAAPHSSWWDGVWGLLLRSALGVDIAYMAKRELFRGPAGWLLRRLGGIPTERGAASGLVGQSIARFQATPRFWLGIAPEGTRRAVKRWKTGFWHIARAAGVPVLPVAFDYPSRTITIGAPFHASADLAADLAVLGAFYAPFRGRHRNVGPLA